MFSFLKAIGVSGGASILTALLGAVTNKIIALAGGTEGMGFFGLIRQFVQVTITLSSLNAAPAVVRNVASRSGAESLRYLRVGVVIYAAGGALCGLLIILFAAKIAGLLFAEVSQDLVYAVRVSAIVILLGVAAGFITAVVNGYREIGWLAFIQIAAATATACLAYPAIHYIPAPYAYLLILAIGFLVTALVGGWWLKRHGPTKEIKGETESPLSEWRCMFGAHFRQAGALVVVGIVGAGAMLLIRSLYLHVHDLKTVGLFESAWTLSTMYVSLLLSAVGTYYIPTLSMLGKGIELAKFVRKSLRMMIFLGALVVSAAIMFKVPAILLFYSPEFLSAEGLLHWLMIGDYLKICSWMLGALLIAFAENRIYLVSDLITSSGLLLGAYVVLPYAWEALGLVYILVWGCYLLFVWRHAARAYRIVLGGKMVRDWLFGLALVLISSALAWGDNIPALSVIVLWMLCCIIFASLFFSHDDVRSIKRVFSEMKEGRLKMGINA